MLWPTASDRDLRPAQLDWVWVARLSRHSARRCVADAGVQGKRRSGQPAILAPRSLSVARPSAKTDRSGDDPQCPPMKWATTALVMYPWVTLTHESAAWTTAGWCRSIPAAAIIWW